MAAFLERAIPARLLDGSGGSSATTSSAASGAGEGWSFGPFRFPANPTQQRPGAGGGSARAGAGGPADAIQQLCSLVGEALHPSSGRGGPASTSGVGGAFGGGAARGGPAAGARRSAIRLEYTEDAPHLLGRRSISLRPRGLPLSGAEPLYDDRDTRWFDVRDTALHGSYSWALQDFQEEREDAPVPGDAWRADVPSDVELAPVLTCKDLVKQVLVDQVGRGDAVQCAFPDQACPSGWHKVMAFSSPVPEDDDAANYLDFHFYLQHKDVSITLQPEDKLSDVAKFFRVAPEDLYDANPGLASVPADRAVGRERSVLVPGANVWSHKPSEWLPPRLHDGAGRAIHNPQRAVAAYSDDEGGLNELPAQFCCAFCVKRGEAKTGPQPRPPGAAVE
ncbi:hypothetical protein HYH03_012130 [Edaphochlamys debaryana]|uniref:LysM domain-containing protein n=1 Tax=Edaphochlamys debaryana TaxID=47281 RepID=A0A836BVQ9_9CHLO|nr:hypothetical protein HYH03_012130 [Edaphochlamys debaryana]|eukprot:KAG2489298.1 hypothetical protein HYH03_012130 [Edaphochlamys debaryana]